MSNQSVTISPGPPTFLVPTHSSYTKSTSSNSISLIECTWAINFPEVQKACILSRVCSMSPPKECKLNIIPPILQEGPTCGLVAISMIFNGKPSAEDLLKIAVERKYSKNGEMFSAPYLLELLQSQIEAINRPCLGDDETTNIFLHNGNLNCGKVKKYLKNGGCVLVPYDPDYNHSPCLRMGHKAHWALILGYLIDDNEQFHVIARHGKSKNLAIWSLKSLAESNSNLIEFAQPKAHPDFEFILPEGGLSGYLGLKDKCIIIENMKYETIDCVRNS